MNLSSTKNPLVISFLIGFVANFPQEMYAAKYEYQLQFDSRYGIHSYGAPNAATNRHTFEYEQKAEFNNQWSAVLGLRIETELAYASVPDRYGIGDIAKKDSQSFFLRDNYLQYLNGIFRARAGYQQVVWGEAFGLYYADIVNSKDYREAGLGGLSRNRLNSPMVNLQWIFSNSSIQVLCIPVAKYSLMPSSGSDFNSFTLPSSYSSYALTINRDPIDLLTRAEYGVRFTKQISHVDLSLFYLNYYDRLPIYQLQIIPSSQSAIALPDFKPLQTGGVTATFDLNGFLIRSEILQHFSREFNIGDSANLSSAKANELIYALGLDLPQAERWQVGLQYSESRLPDNNWLGRTKLQSIAGLRVVKTFNNNAALEVQLTDITQDSSTLTQVQFSLPISSRTEFHLGFDRFDGGTDSVLGRFKNASRGWLMFRATFKN